MSGNVVIDVCILMLKWVLVQLSCTLIRSYACSLARSFTCWLVRLLARSFVRSTASEVTKAGSRAPKKGDDIFYTNIFRLFYAIIQFYGCARISASNAPNSKCTDFNSVFCVHELYVFTGKIYIQFHSNILLFLSLHEMIQSKHKRSALFASHNKKNFMDFFSAFRLNILIFL